MLEVLFNNTSSAIETPILFDISEQRSPGTTQFELLAQYGALEQTGLIAMDTPCTHL